MTTDVAEKLDALTPHQLIDEIQQIATQYAAEVPGKRRNWPESIRARILALGRLGVPRKKISELTGIPAATVFLWCRDLPRTRRPRTDAFIQLPHKSNPTVRLSTINPTAGLESTGTRRLTLKAPNGFIFEGLGGVDDLVRLYRELSR